MKLFPDLENLKDWRKNGLEFYHQSHNIVYWEKVDDLLVTEEGLLVPFDYKVTTSNNLYKYTTLKKGNLNFTGICLAN